MPCSSACSNMAENLRYQRKCYHFGVLAAREKTHKKACFFVVAWRHRTQPPSQAGVGFGLWLGSPGWFLPKLGRRGIKLRRKQGPTSWGAPPLWPSTERSALRRTASLVFLWGSRVLAGACQRHGVGGFLLFCCKTTTAFACAGVARLFFFNSIFAVVALVFLHGTAFMKQNRGVGIPRGIFSV